MNIAVNSDSRIIALKVTKETITSRLADGRTISVPLAWSWRLADATQAQRNKLCDHWKWRRRPLARFG